jgi:hypothetical protein
MENPTLQHLELLPSLQKEVIAISEITSQTIKSSSIQPSVETTQVKTFSGSKRPAIKTTSQNMRHAPITLPQTRLHLRIHIGSSTASRCTNGLTSSPATQDFVSGSLMEVLDGCRCVDARHLASK